jgi:hypothetical protein
VQHGGEADAGAEVLRVGCDGGQRLGRGLEPETVDDGLVLIGDVGDRPRQRKDDMVVGDRQQIGLPLGEPLPGRCTLALRAMTVAAGVVGDTRVRTIFAALDIAGRVRRGSMIRIIAR